MAYNNYAPMFSPAWYGQQYYPPIPPTPMQPTPGASQPVNRPTQIQGPMPGGFVRVQSEQEARAYPVAPGNSITFIDESRPYCYTKSVDMSQLDRPKFDRYRLVKEEDDPVSANGSVGLQNGLQGAVPGGGSKDTEYALKTDLDRLSQTVEALRRRIDKEEAKPDGEPVD